MKGTENTAIDRSAADKFIRYFLKWAEILTFLKVALLPWETEDVSSNPCRTIYLIGFRSETYNLKVRGWTLVSFDRKKIWAVWDSYQEVKPVPHELYWQRLKVFYQ